ncbi:MAG: methyltransferase domain-containing protein [Parvularculaceae bacterium]
MNIQDNVKDYYGKTLQSSTDLKTDACCTIEATPAYLRTAFTDIHPDVSARYYGCGLVAPLALEGARILDLGCGAGRDVYALSRLVGESGAVVGVDFTEQQLDVARETKEWHAERYGYAKSNVEFIEGDIEKLGSLGLDGASFDVIVSNCVINLVEDKKAVFAAARNLLKPGGEFYFSDVYADRRLEDDLRYDKIARGECLGGALYWNDFLNIAGRAGFADPRLVTSRPLAISHEDLKARLEPAEFHSATYRLFAIEGLEPACEDYGQAVVYKGGVPHSENQFILDGHHAIDKGRIFPVCGNTYRMLNETRFARYFDFIGDWSTHYGIFPGCGTSSPFAAEPPEAATSGACC